MLSAMDWIEEYDPKVAKTALKMRHDGASVDKISRYVSAATDRDIGRTTVANWLKRREAKK